MIIIPVSGRGGARDAAPPGAAGSSEPVGLREALRRQPSGLGAVADPVSEVLFRHRPGPVGGVLPGEALRKREHLGVRDAAALVALEPNALAAAHLGQLPDREHEELAVLA